MPSAPRGMRGRRSVVERNLRRIHGNDISRKELDREVDQVFDSYARYWLESFRLPGTHPALIEDGMAVDGYEHIDDALDKGGGVILALPHLGGWEWAAFWLAESKGRKVTAVVEPVEPPELAEWFVGLRRDIGINVVPLGPSAGTECVRALKANDILCLLCDRDLAGGGVEVEFFGERTTLPGGPATLALRSGAPLLPDRRLLRGHRPPRPRAPAPAGRAAGQAPRRRGPHHPGPRQGARAAHPPCPRPVAPHAAQLALGPRERWERPGQRTRGGARRAWRSSARPVLRASGRTGAPSGRRRADGIAPTRPAARAQRRTRAGSQPISSLGLYRCAGRGAVVGRRRAVRAPT